MTMTLTMKIKTNSLMIPNHNDQYDKVKKVNSRCSIIKKYSQAGNRIETDEKKPAKLTKTSLSILLTFPCHSRAIGVEDKGNSESKENHCVFSRKIYCVYSVQEQKHKNALVLIPS